MGHFASLHLWGSWVDQAQGYHVGVEDTAVPRAEEQ